MSFESPACLLLIAPALVWAVPWRRPAASACLAFPAAAAAAVLRPSLRRRLLPLVPWLRFLLLALLAVALARPRSGTEHLSAGARGIDIQLVLDVSSSMTRTDLAAGRTRLEVARETIGRFVRGRPEDRIGLLTFARYPRPACPLTLDHAALLEFLAQVRPVASNSAENTTAIGVALAAAAMHLQADEERTRVVVLLTDGEEMEHEIEPAEAAELARAYGVKVYTIAVATRSGRFARELARVAEITGGRGFAATDAAALAAVYARIDKLERKEVVESRLVEWRDLHPPVLCAILALFLLGLMAEACVLRRGPA